MGILSDAFSGQEHDFTRLPLARGVLLLALPTTVELGLQSGFAVADLLFVGPLGAAALAAVGLTETLMIVLYTVASGLAIPAAALVAARVGAADRDGAAVAAVQALALGVALAVALGLPATLFAAMLLDLAGASEDVAAIAVPYAQIQLASSPLVMVLAVGGAALRGGGAARDAMLALGLAAVVNLVLDPALIYGWGPFPELGLTGAAVASAVGRVTGVIALAWALLARRGPVRIAPRHLVVDRGTLRTLARMAGGGIGQGLVESGSWVVLIRLAAGLGDPVVAAVSIVLRALGLALAPMYGMGGAASTLVGQNLGAGRPERALRAVWTAGLGATAVIVPVGALLVVWPEAVVGVFTPEAEVADVAVAGLRIVGYGSVLYGWGQATTQALNGAGDTVTPTWINLVSLWGVQLPLAWLLTGPLGWGADGLWIAVSCAYMLVSALGLWRVQASRWARSGRDAGRGSAPTPAAGSQAPRH